MGPARKTVDRSRFDEPTGRDIPAGVESEAPEMEEQDWDELEGAEPDSMPENGDFRYVEKDGIEMEGDLPEEDDDNPDQESDEALPDDEDEQAIRRDLGGEGIRYEPE